MKGFVKGMDKLSLIVKLILAIPLLDFIWGIYRICKSALKKNTLGIILGLVLLIAAPIMWLIDIICLLVSGKIWWID